MIKLDVEPYCHDCPNFDAEQHRTNLYFGEHLESMSDCLISCEHQSVCKRIESYLKSKIEKERTRTFKEDKEND